MAKPRRPRTERRERERMDRKHVRERETVTAALPGGSPERPLAVNSASVIDGHARSLPCVQCAGDMDLRDHVAETHGGRLLRRARLLCRRCHAPRSLWFTIKPAVAN